LENLVANLFQFHSQKALFKDPKNLKHKILEIWEILKMTPPPFKLSQKFIHFGVAIRPYEANMLL